MKLSKKDQGEDEESDSAKKKLVSAFFFFCLPYMTILVTQGVVPPSPWVKGRLLR